jgi:hypothetical protein
MDAKDTLMDVISTFFFQNRPLLSVTTDKGPNLFFTHIYTQNPDSNFILLLCTIFFFFEENTVGEFPTA